MTRLICSRGIQQVHYCAGLLLRLWKVTWVWWSRAMFQFPLLWSWSSHHYQLTEQGSSKPLHWNHMQCSTRILLRWTIADGANNACEIYSITANTWRWVTLNWGKRRHCDLLEIHVVVNKILSLCHVCWRNLLAVYSCLLTKTLGLSLLTDTRPVRHKLTVPPDEAGLFR